MDTVTFVSQPVVSNWMMALFAIVSASCYIVVFLIAGKAFKGYPPITYMLTVTLGSGLAIVANFLVYSLMLS